MSIRKISKPVVGLVLIGLALSPALAVQALHTPEDTTTILVWSQWTDPLPASISQAYSQYEVLHPEIDIQFYSPVDLIAELDAAFASGTPPDIVVWGNDIVGSRALAGQIVDLRTLGVTEISLKAIFEDLAVEAGKYWGGLYGVPHSTEAIALVYNKDFVADAFMPTDPLDFDALFIKAQQYLTATGNELVCNQGFGIGSYDPYHAAPVFFGYGVPEYVDTDGTVYANVPAAISAGNWIDNFRQVSDSDSGYSMCKLRLLNGEAGSWWTGPWAIPELKDQNVDFGIVPMGKPFVGVRMHMITTAAIQRGRAAVALDLIEYVTNFTNSKRYATWDRIIPANSAALADPEVQALPEVAAFGQAAAMGVPMGNSAFHYCQWEPMGEAVDAIWSDTKTPQAALDDAQEQIEACVQVVMENLYPQRIYLPLLKR